jgi:hypothetical protein
MYRDTVARCLLLVHRCWTSLTPIATEGILFPTVVAYVSLLSVSFTSLRLAKHLVSLYYPEGAGPDQRYVTFTHFTLTQFYSLTTFVLCCAVLCCAMDWWSVCRSMLLSQEFMKDYIYYCRYYGKNTLPANILPPPPFY